MMWEYLVRVCNTESAPEILAAELDRLGVDGWELCAAPTSRHGGVNTAVLVFKRPRERRDLPPPPAVENHTVGIG